MVAHTCYLSSLEAEPRGIMGGLGQLRLCNEFQADLGYRVRACCNQPKKTKIVKEITFKKFKGIF